MSQNQSDSPLVDFLSSLYPFGPEALEYLRKHSFKKEIGRGKFLLRPGEICLHYYYIHKGLLRAFSREGNKEITTWLNPEREISTSIRSMIRRQPAMEYIQALEDSELYVLHFDDLENMYSLFPEMNFVARKILTAYYADAEERSYISRIPNAGKRYRYFVSSRPDLANRAPLKYIASYLGITLETLSRLRSKSGHRADK
ncbi:MAG TPA: Crp/Fnr family transcriptional regulator [Puia sp.]|nr:Crp/Fnr family transcriptional regulator [Puia sp.]